MLRRHTYFAMFVMALAGTAAADPKSPQCWDCLQHLAMGLPAVNAQEDPSYEQGLTPGSVLPALANCSLDDGELPTLHRIIKIFTDAQVENGGAEYVRDHLAQLPDVTRRRPCQAGRWGEAGLGHDVAPLGGSQLQTAVAIALR